MPNLTMNARTGAAVALATTLLLAAACADDTARSAGETRPAASGGLDCVPLPEGEVFQVRGGLLVPYSPEPQIIERLVERPLDWADTLEARFPDMGFPWLGLDARRAERGFVALTGLAPTADAKRRALAAGEDAIKALPEGRDLFIVDAISVEGGEAAVGAAVATLDAGTSVAQCQRAFSDTMSGRNVTFDSGTDRINQESARLLDAVTAIGILCQSHTIEIAGHTDQTGTETANQRLSERRANAVRDYLIERGVPATALEAVGYGESQLLDSRNTPEAHERNRRTEFIVRTRD